MNKKVQAFKKEVALTRSAIDPGAQAWRIMEHIIKVATQANKASDLIDALKKMSLKWLQEKQERFVRSELKAIGDMLDKAARRSIALTAFLRDSGY